MIRFNVIGLRMVGVAMHMVTGWPYCLILLIFWTSLGFLQKNEFSLPVDDLPISLCRQSNVAVTVLYVIASAPTNYL